MRAVQYDRFGPPEVLRVNEVPVPQPGPGEVLVAVHAAGVEAGRSPFVRDGCAISAGHAFPAASAATSPAASRRPDRAFTPGEPETRCGG